MWARYVPINAMFDPDCSNFSLVTLQCFAMFFILSSSKESNQCKVATFRHWKLHSIGFGWTCHQQLITSTKTFKHFIRETRNIIIIHKSGRQSIRVRWFEEEWVPDLVIIVELDPVTMGQTQEGWGSTMIRDVTVIRSAKSLHSSLWFISLLRFIPWSSKSFHPKQLFTPFTQGLHPL